MLQLRDGCCMGKPSEPVACLVGFLERYTQLEGEIGLA